MVHYQLGLARKSKEQVEHELFDDNNDDAWQIKQGADSATWRLTSLRDSEGRYGFGTGRAIRFTTITTSPGERRTRKETCGLCAREPHRHFPGRRDFVGGSIRDISVIIEGNEHEDAAHTLYSTVHGARRVMAAWRRKVRLTGSGEVKPCRQGNSGNDARVGCTRTSGVPRSGRRRIAALLQESAGGAGRARGIDSRSAFAGAR